MITRALSFLTDLIIFLFVYCFLFVSILILFFDRNTDYDRFISIFYIFLGITGYLYFLLPLFFKGQTLGKRLFKITVEYQGKENIIKFHLKYIFFRLFPLIALLLVFYVDVLVLQIFFGLFVLYPLFDLLYLYGYNETFTDKLLSLEVTVY